MPGVQARHERAARRGAYGAAGVEVGEAHAFRGQPVQIGRLDLRLAVASQVPIAEVIGENEDDARFAHGGAGRVAALRPQAAERGRRRKTEEKGSPGPAPVTEMLARHTAKSGEPAASRPTQFIRFN